MNEPLLLSRARIRTDVPAAALRALFTPEDDGRRAGAGHRLVWTLFSDAPDRQRDFLWRETESGTYYLLSRRPPEDRHGLFHLDPAKPFAPRFDVGERLRFSLRANATISRSAGPGQRGKPSDVVMDAIHHLPPGSRADARSAAVTTAGLRWLDAQGARSGFTLVATDDEGGETVAAAAATVTGYRTLRVEHAGPTARIGVLDFEGMLEVREPDRFLDALGQGFGRAKAFGCGMMLVRRA